MSKVDHANIEPAVVVVHWLVGSTMMVTMNAMITSAVDCFTVDGVAVWTQFLVVDHIAIAVRDGYFRWRTLRFGLNIT